MDAVDYLLKPFSLTRFLRACNKAYELYMARHSEEVADFIYVKTGFEQLKVNFDEIRYLEATGNYVTFVLNDKDLMSRMTFAEALTLLPTEKFVRVHRSYVVALPKIDKYERHQLILGNRKVPVSEAYRQNLVALLKNKS